jgi:hypothetical protein
MMQIAADFGFYPDRLSLKIGDISIDTRADLDEITSGFENWEGIEKDWIYAPPQQERTFGGIVRELPYRARVFGLPRTHTIAHASADGHDHLQFHVSAPSFFLGMRLTTTDRGVVDATPIKSHKLVDFGLSHNSLPKAVELAERFWVDHRHEPVRSKRFLAIIHALFVAQYPQHLQYEEFIYLYSALDACYALAASIHAPKKKPTHPDRINWMCDHFRMKTPDWALEPAVARAEVAILRNATLHEALFMGEPLGFAIHGIGSNTNLPLDMRALVCRLLVALIGARAATYVKSPINTRMRHFLDLP